MYESNGSNEARVAVMVDRDHTKPEILEFALKVLAQFGRVVVRRGNGNPSTPANRWQEALVRWAFTPCLHPKRSIAVPSGSTTGGCSVKVPSLWVILPARSTRIPWGTRRPVDVF